MAFPLRRDDPFGPPSEYAELRIRTPVCPVRLPTGAEAWVLTRHADVRALLGDPTVSSDIRRPEFPAMGLGEQEAGARTRPFIRTDPPRHTRFRSLFVAEFTPRRITAARPDIESLVADLVGGFARSDAPDLARLANAVTTTVVCSLLGVPADDVEFFRDVTRISGSRHSSSEQVGEALGELFGLIGALVAARRTQPTDDLVGRLVAGPLAEGIVTDDELVSAIAMTVIAGRETTTSMISLGALYLLEHPELRAELTAHPELWPAAVDELLRVLSVGDSLGLRVLTEARSFSGVDVPAGAGVIGLLGAANHDPEVYPRPGVVDLARAGAPHLAFGHGRHSCFGAMLAKLEIEVALRTVFDRLPGLAVAGAVEYKHESATFGVERAPVRVGSPSRLTGRGLFTHGKKRVASVYPQQASPTRR